MGIIQQLLEALFGSSEKTDQKIEIRQDRESHREVMRDERETRAAARTATVSTRAAKRQSRNEAKTAKLSNKTARRENRGARQQAKADNKSEKKAARVERRSNRRGR